MARRVDEGQRTSVLFDLVRTDVLGDAAGLTGDHVRVADAVEELRLAVVDVAHDGDDRRTMRLAGVLAVVVLVVELQQLLQLDLLLFTRIDELDLGTDLGREQLDHVVGQRLRGRDHLALLHQEPHHVRGGAVDLRSELLRRGGALDHHDTLGHGGLVGRVGRAVHRLQLVTATAATALSALGWAALGATGATTRASARTATAGRSTTGTTSAGPSTWTTGTTGAWGAGATHARRR